jgi:hypothetical protein
MTVEETETFLGPIMQLRQEERSKPKTVSRADSKGMCQTARLSGI